MARLSYLSRMAVHWAAASGLSLTLCWTTLHGQEMDKGQDVCYRKWGSRPSCMCIVRRPGNLTAVRVASMRMELTIPCCVSIIVLYLVTVVGAACS